jgi:hypothetical protein
LSRSQRHDDGENGKDDFDHGNRDSKRLSRSAFSPDE